jgi:plastocyanin
MFVQIEGPIVKYNRSEKIIWTAAALSFGLAALLYLLPARESFAGISISQKGQAFRTGEAHIKKGEAIEIVNDDGDLLHHAYVSAPNFSFDSGDQAPGSRIQLTIPARGSFDVLCAIHPRMKLRVVVE